ncbi:MAG: TIGR02444 family protein [Porticoccaceae bacterium]|nr:TIGR02444 family protein [Porticoccaceae bacterium]
MKHLSVEKLPIQNPVWDFSVAVYQQPGVANYCISLQDKHNALVNLVLFCCWLGTCRCRLSEETLKQVEQVIVEYNLTVTQTLRVRRRALTKTGADYGAVKAKLLEEELYAEQEEQNALFAWFRKITFPAGRDCEALITANVQVYLDSLDPDLECPRCLIDAALKYRIGGVAE